MEKDRWLRKQTEQYQFIMSVPKIIKDGNVTNNDEKKTTVGRVREDFHEDKVFKLRSDEKSYHPRNLEKCTQHWGVEKESLRIKNTMVT